MSANRPEEGDHVDPFDPEPYPVDYNHHFVGRHDEWLAYQDYLVDESDVPT